MSRVVVVAIVVFAFAVASLPASAAPRGGETAAKAESGWFEAAVAWMSQVIFGDQPAKPKKSSPKFVTPWNGSCIDPLGGCTPG
jgi:hypothetical protein